MKTQGFTLIELLVVIAIIGVMAAAVLVAINPSKHIADAKDSNRKSAVVAIGGASESCYTLKGGSWSSCVIIDDLVDGGYLKQDPTLSLSDPLYPWSCSAGCVAVKLEDPPAVGVEYWMYDASLGKAGYAASACDGSCYP